METTFFNVVSLLKDCIVAGAAVCSVAIASHALNTWTRQLRGTTEFDVAKRALSSANRLIRAIRLFRASLPGRLGSLEPLIPDLNITREDRLVKRWEFVDREWEKFYEVAVEAGGLWGSGPLADSLDTLMSLVSELHNDLRTLIRLERQQVPATDQTKNLLLSKLNDVPTDTVSPVGRRIVAAEQAISAALRPYLSLSASYRETWWQALWTPLRRAWDSTHPSKGKSVDGEPRP